MAKGDDALAKKKNKAIRKRNRRAGAGTTEAIEGVQSHKRRRKAGTRRVCEAMCYSLPTPEDPFLNRKKYNKNRESFQGNGFAKREDGEPTTDRVRRVERSVKKKSSGASNGVKAENDKMSLALAASEVSLKGHVRTSGSAPLKKVVWDPSFDRTSSRTEDALSVAGRAFQSAAAAVCEVRDSDDSTSSSTAVGEFEQRWWQGCAQGAGVLGSGRGTPCIQAYVVGAAPHVAVQRRSHGSTHDPMALILVNSKDQAHSVREICKPIKKVLNIHSISLHSDASVEHQVNGLAMQTPEIVIATPERLCQLLSLRALSLSAVSYVVVDGLDDMVNGGCREHLDSIRQQLQKGVQIGILSKTFPADVVSATGNWLQHPIVRAVTEKNVAACGVCIKQSVYVVTTEEAKLSKMNKILAQLCTNLDNNEITGDLLLVVKGKEQYPLMKELLRNHKFVPHFPGELATALRNERRGVLVTAFDASYSPELLANVEVTVNYDLCWPVHRYTHVLTAMARSSLKGRIETICSGAAALQAKGLADLLDSCEQLVPKPLSLLAQAAALVPK